MSDQPATASCVSSLEGGVLACASGVVPQALVEEHLYRHYALHGDLLPIAGERDRNYRLSIEGEPAFVVKVAHPAEQRQVLEGQARAANHVRAVDGTLPVHRTLAAADGQLLTTLAHGDEQRIFRVVDWLPGDVMVEVPLSPDLGAAIGTVLARVDKALAGFSGYQASDDLLWDLSKAGRLSGLLPHIAGDPMRGAAEHALAAYDAAMTHLAALPRQAIHGDFNPHNILVDSSAVRVAGVLDFGDMQVAPRLCDLAIACAYLWKEESDPFRYIEACVSAYHREFPIEGEMAETLVDLIAMRYAMTLLITEWRARRHPDNARYILRNNPTARKGLRSLDEQGRSQLRTRLAAIFRGTTP